MPENEKKRETEAKGSIVEMRKGKTKNIVMKRTVKMSIWKKGENCKEKGDLRRRWLNILLLILLLSLFVSENV